MIALPDLADDAVRASKAHCLEPTAVSRAILAGAVRKYIQAHKASLDLLRIPSHDEHDRALCEDVEDYVI